jgi:carboxymethylenebutenolidase
MSNDLQLTAADGFRLDAYLAQPAGAPRGGLIVLQEIFGVNSHIRSVADRYAAEGYLVIAPALFDRAEPGVNLGYTPEDMKAGVAIRAKVPGDKTLLDIQVALQHVQGAGKVGAVGYCWGGSLAWLSACSLDGLSAAIAYYGSMLPANAGLVARCPVMAHFGAHDHGIPLESVEAFRAAQPAVELHVYEADHGFNCDQRGSYNAAAAALAQQRSSAFFAKHLG